ncbi:MAG: transporter [Candidatus Komeilibacteria bacterium CG10_big_fil_rev_8_21_14_0_10_41_13]|uniref:Probable queuosine precursor transporter n=1 Tax=Candidatus Komeilibacteria bacterium CG10_big_fil_rev_8_21_14_0_10_41_13 TaxID=1974476 RepID=A0A2M6WC24_9BACT|nr:MAG: transporter [Candidatus Komeilibacteria bacterium CG10_big_fil_rev_8_21_14_0_10_41_13]
MSKLTLEHKTDMLVGLFVLGLIASNVLGSKITTLLGVSVSVGIFMYPLTFLVTDVIAEVYGKKRSYNLILTGFITLIILLALTYLSISLPASSRYAANESYLTVFRGSIRIIIASLVAFLLSQFHDVWSFHFWKTKTKGKWLWLRNNLSTFTSQLIDTVIFVFLAFYKVAPQFDFAFMWHLIIPYFLFKIAFALIDTPFVYWGVSWLKKSQHD